MENLELFKTAVVVVIFIIKFSIGLHIDLNEYRSLFRGSLMQIVKALAIVILAAPFVAWLIAYVLSPSTGALVTIIMLSATPGAPLSILKINKAGGKPEMAVAIQMLAVLISVLTVPLVLHFFHNYMKADIDPEWTSLMRRILLYVIAPFVLGLVLNILLPSVKTAKRIVARIAQIMLGVMALLLIIKFYKLIFNAAPQDILIFSVFIILTLLIGHLLGGPDKKDRTTIALLSSSPHIGLTIFIAITLFNLETIMAYLLPYLVINLLIGMLYIQWRKRV